MIGFGVYPNDKVMLKDGKVAIVIYNVIGTTTFRLELLEDGKRTGKVITEDRNNFKKVN